MGPRANFGCTKCGVTHEDLPVESTRCPVTGFKRGFKRLYDAVQIAGGKQHGAAQIVDKVAVPEMQTQNAIRESAQRYNAQVAQIGQHNHPLAAQLQQMGAALNMPAQRVRQGEITYRVPNVSGVIDPLNRTVSSQRNVGLIKAFGPPRPIAP